MCKEDVSSALGQCARALFSMTNLRSVKLHGIEIDDEFFSVMAELASGSQVNNICIYHVGVDFELCN